MNRKHKKSVLKDFKMRNVKYLLIFIISTFLIASCSNENQINQPEDVQAIEEMSAARAIAFNEGNAAGIAIYFTETGVLMAPGASAQTGRIAVEEYYQSIFDEFETSLNSYYEEVEVSGELAFGRGIAEVDLTPKAGGDTIKSTSKYINILQRQQDGSWLTTHDIWNENE